MAVLSCATAVLLPHTGGMRRSATRIARIVGGWALLAVGAALLVLPGPGLLVLAAGLALLATEYAWAARWLRSARAKLARLKTSRRPAAGE